MPGHDYSDYADFGVPLSTAAARSSDKIALFRSLVPRARGCVSAAFRKSQDRPRRLCPGLRQRMGARHLRETPDQVRRLPAPRVPAGDRRGHPLASLRQGYDMARISWRVSIRCWRTKPAYFLAMDFDKDSWREDVLAVMETCRRHGNPRRARTLTLRKWRPCLVVLQRGGSCHARTQAGIVHSNGNHGAAARNSVSHPTTGSFPNQDTLPKGGFGNLIALPLQKIPRESGHSVFVDEELVPLPDQWAFLSAIRRLSRTQVEAIARDAETRGRVTGVRFALCDG